MKKRILSLLLVLALLCSLMPAAFAGSDDTFDLVVFGDSVTNGYGLRGYVEDQVYDWTGTPQEYAAWEAYRFDAPTWNPHDRLIYNRTGYEHIIPGSTAADVANLLSAQGENVKLHQLALSGSRSIELRVLLDNDFDGDAYTKDYENIMNLPEGGLASFREAYQDAVRDAELIVCDVGANDFGSYVSYQLINNAYSYDFRDLFGDSAELFYQFRASVEEAVLAVSDGSETAESIAERNHIIDTFAYALAGYCSSIDNVVMRIRELNPTCRIVVTSVMNTMAGMDVYMDGINVPFGELMGIPIDLGNAYVSALSPLGYEYSYADVSSDGGRCEIYLDRLMSYDGDPDNIDQNMRDAVDVYDDWTFIKEYISQTCLAYGVSLDSDLYRYALDIGYDSIYKFMQVGADSTGVAFDLSTSMEEASHIWYYTVINDSISAAVMAAFGQDYEAFLQSEIESLYSNEAIRFIACMDVRTVLGNGFFAHPTLEGSAWKAQQIVDVYNGEVSRAATLMNALANVRDRWIELGEEFGPAFFDKFLEGVTADMGLDELGIELPDAKQFGDIAQFVLKLSGADNNAIVAEFNKSINKAETDLTVHRHSLRYVSFVAATCTKDGHLGYWRCKECGECFADASGFLPIDESDVVLKAGHTPVFVKGSLFSKTSDHYHCAVCGKDFADFDCTKPYSASSSKTQKSQGSLVSKVLSFLF